jgi:hypothetical protein
MADTKEKYQKYLDNVLQDSAEQLEPDDKVRALSQAVLLYSKDKPLIKVKEETGDGTSYLFALPTDWVENFSYIIDQIEYPADYSQVPSYLDNNSWMYFKKLVTTTTTTYIRLLNDIPSASETLRYMYAIPHSLTVTASTISETDFEAVIALAASICFWALAAKFAQSTDPSIEADVVDYQRISDTYQELAKSKLQYYNTMMGKGGEAKSNAAATAGVSINELDLTYSTGEEYLTHPSSDH